MITKENIHLITHNMRGQKVRDLEWIKNPDGINIAFGYKIKFKDEDDGDESQYWYCDEFGKLDGSENNRNLDLSPIQNQ